MAPSRNHCPNGASAVVIIMSLLIIITHSLPLFPSKSVGLGLAGEEESSNSKQMKMVLGSRPPKCVNRCLSCRPCTAALVIPPHHKNGVQTDESYYLVSWKCRCGSKLFQP